VGILDTIYSASEGLKRRARNVARDPAGALEQASDEIKRRLLVNPTEVALDAFNPPMAGGLAGVIKQKGGNLLTDLIKDGRKYIDAYHGSKTPEGVVKEDKLLPGGGSLGIQSGNAYGTGVYSSNLPDTASSRAYTGSEGAVFPLKIDVSNHLDLGNLTTKDYEKLNKLAESILLPSDKSMLQPRNASINIKDKNEAHDFFVNQLENWKQFGGGIERAKPKASETGEGFNISYTDYDAPVSVIDTPSAAETLLKTVGWDNTAAMGYSGHILPKSGGENWHITADPSKIRSRFAKFKEEDADKIGLGLAEGGLIDNSDGMNAPEFADGGFVRNKFIGTPSTGGVRGNVEDKHWSEYL